MKKTLMAIAMMLGSACVAQAYTVRCSSSTATSIEYTLVVGAAESGVNGLGLGYFASVTPIFASFYVKNNIGAAVAGWSVTDTVGTGNYTQNPAFVAEGTTQPGYNLLITGPNLYAVGGTALTFAGGSTYYFGYNVAAGAHTLGEVGFHADGSLDNSNDNWAAGANQGSGPVYAFIPEPTSFALIGLGAAVMALRRRKIQA